jgi:hypothetical protein
MPPVWMALVTFGLLWMILNINGIPLNGPLMMFQEMGQAMKLSSAPFTIT